jgi:hypothetical protein
MKIKVDFKKLVWGDYYPFRLNLELEMINWLFKTGLEGGGYQEQPGWSRSGVNQLLYGYSGNDEIGHTEPFPIHNSDYLRCFINAVFTRAFLAPYSYNGSRGRFLKKKSSHIFRPNIRKELEILTHAMRRYASGDNTGILINTYGEKHDKI